MTLAAVLKFVDCVDLHMEAAAMTYVRWESCRAAGADGGHRSAVGEPEKRHPHTNTIGRNTPPPPSGPGGVSHLCQRVVTSCLLMEQFPVAADLKHKARDGEIGLLTRSPWYVVVARLSERGGAGQIVGSFTRRSRSGIG